MNVNHLRNRRGFTLVELLVVIGIIGVLVSILVPVAGKMRQTGYKTDTANQLNVIRTAIEMYHQTFQAYPGPFSNQQICTLKAKDLLIGVGGDNLTMAESLVLGLLGGIEQRPTDKLPRYDSVWVGTGPRVLVASNPKRYEPFMAMTSGWLSDGMFKEAETQRTVCQDSSVPEFVDRYAAQPMPILYLRARLGAPGIIAANSKDAYQYDIRQITPYTGGKIYGHDQGLRIVGGDMSLPFKQSSLSDALPYFRNPALCPDKEKDQSKGTPRAKDGYILISAGQDRIYGTVDDITSFGNVGE